MKSFKKYINVLTIAGSDSGAGAGIQADLKTFSALGCYGTSVIAAITCQNTLGVRSIHSVPVKYIKDQLEAVLEDIKPVAIKIGMLNKPEVVELLSEILKEYREIPIILDPVMIATSGDKLIKDETVSLLKEKLFPISTLITPNIDEAIVLSNQKISNQKDMFEAAKIIMKSKPKAVLIKGGHLKGDIIYDIFLDNSNDSFTFESEYIKTKNLHGTGCTLSSAIAAELAKGNNLKQSIQNAKIYITEALKSGADVKTGEGNGPLNHFYKPLELIKI